MIIIPQIHILKTILYSFALSRLEHSYCSHPICVIPRRTVWLVLTRDLRLFGKPQS